MALPTKKKPLKKRGNAEQVQKAIETVKSMGTPEVDSEITKNEDFQPPRSKRPMGRPSPIKRGNKFTLLLSEETFERFQFAFVKQQIKYKKQNKILDKSFLIETVLKDWLDASGY